MEKLMNVENKLSDSIDASKLEGVVRRIEVEEVQFAMNDMKSLTNIFNDILFKDKLPEEWMLNSLVPIFKGKGDPLDPNCYRNMLLNCTRRF